MAVPHAIHALDLPGYRVAVCWSRAEIQACAAGYQDMPDKPEYGVVNPEQVTPSKEPMARLTWVGAWEEGTGRLVGVVRLKASVDLSRNANLTLFAQQSRLPHRVVEVGAHLLSEGRVRGIVFEGLCTVALSYLVATETTLVYIHVKPTQAKRYTALGFQVVTAPFQPAVFPTWWQGMLLCLETVPVLWAEPAFQQSWKRQTGVPLRGAFWRRVMERQREVKVWTGKRLVVDVVTETPIPVPGPQKSKKN